MDPQTRATELLAHYFRTVFRAAGVDWDGDNYSEVAAIVDALLDLIREEIRDHAEQAPHVYPDGSTS